MSAVIAMELRPRILHTVAMSVPDASRSEAAPRRRPSCRRMRRTQSRGQVGSTSGRSEESHRQRFRGVVGSRGLCRMTMPGRSNPGCSLSIIYRLAGTANLILKRYVVGAGVVTSSV